MKTKLLRMRDLDVRWKPGLAFRNRANCRIEIGRSSRFAHFQRNGQQEVFAPEKFGGLFGTSM